jgi:hypothetical protein
MLEQRETIAFGGPAKVSKSSIFLSHRGLKSCW